MPRSKVVLGLTHCIQSKPMLPLTTYVWKNLTSYTASVVRPPEWWPHLRGPPLEDPSPMSREPIHLLIGADLYGSLLSSDRRRDPLGTPTAQKTELGWIISGPVDIGSYTVFEAHVSHCVSECNADSLLRKSWADEKISAEIIKPTVHYVDCASDWRLPHRYPNWPRLVKRTAYARRFIENSKRKKNVQFEAKKEFANSCKELPIDVSESREAVQLWFRFVQKAHFPKEWDPLSNNEPIQKSSAPKSSNPTLAGVSLLRLGGRLRLADGCCPRIFRETFYHIATTSHHWACSSSYSTWWHASYAAHSKRRILDHRRSKSRQDA